MSNGENEVTTIPKIRRVIYDTYANFPATGLSVGDLAFATDRSVLYRWNGATWDYVTFHCSSGIVGAIPAAVTLPNGSLYYATDTQILYQNQAASWVQVASTAVTAHSASHLAGASDAIFGLPKLVIKTADETVNNSSALQNDDHLFFAGAINEVWLIKFLALCDSSTVADIKFGWSLPAGATLFRHILHFQTAVTTIAGQSLSTVAAVAPMGVGVGSIYAIYREVLIVKIAGTAGNIQLQWAQSAAEATDTKVRIGSVLEATKLI